MFSKLLHYDLERAVREVGNRIYLKRAVLVRFPDGRFEVMGIHKADLCIGVDLLESVASFRARAEAGGLLRTSQLASQGE